MKGQANEKGKMTDLQFTFMIICYLGGVIGMLGLTEDDYDVVPRILAALFWPIALPVIGWFLTLQLVARFLFGDLVA